MDNLRLFPDREVLAEEARDALAQLASKAQTARIAWRGSTPTARDLIAVADLLSAYLAAIRQYAATMERGG